MLCIWNYRSYFHTSLLRGIYTIQYLCRMFPNYVQLLSLQAFQLMDQDKDGIISKNDLRATFDQLGRLPSDKELDEMVNEAPGPINFTQLLTLFAGRMSGGV